MTIMTGSKPNEVLHKRNMKKIKISEENVTQKSTRGQKIGDTMYWIINTKKKTYKQVERSEESFDGDWKEKYPHTKGADWAHVYVASLWEYDRTRNGIYFEYDLCCDGGMFRMYVDTDRHSPEDIEHAKKEIKGDRDVVSLRVIHLKKAQLQ